jgi:hypothetical protein
MSNARWFQYISVLPNILRIQRRSRSDEAANVQSVVCVIVISYYDSSIGAVYTCIMSVLVLILQLLSKVAFSVRYRTQSEA